MDNDEKDSIGWNASQAWNRYNPKWLLDKVDETRGDNDFIFDITEVHEAFKAGFMMGVMFKLTGDIPWEGEP